MSDVKKYGVSVPSLNLVTKKDLNGIKKALLFFIERERDKELFDQLELASYNSGWRDDKYSEAYQNKIRKRVNKKYDALMKGLK
jgi:hypothetical protein